MLTELVSTLVAALGQNAANVALAIPTGIPFANAEGGEARTPQPARHELILVHVEGVLGADV